MLKVPIVLPSSTVLGLEASSIHDSLCAASRYCKKREILGFLRGIVQKNPNLLVINLVE